MQGSKGWSAAMEGSQVLTKAQVQERSARGAVCALYYLRNATLKETRA